MIVEDAIMEDSIEESRYNAKSRYYDGFSAESGISQFLDFTVQRFSEVSGSEITGFRE